MYRNHIILFHTLKYIKMWIQCKSTNIQVFFFLKIKRKFKVKIPFIVYLLQCFAILNAIMQKLPIVNVNHVYKNILKTFIDFCYYTCIKVYCISILNLSLTYLFSCFTTIIAFEFLFMNFLNQSLWVKLLTC